MKRLGSRRRGPPFARNAFRLLARPLVGLGHRRAFLDEPEISRIKTGSHSLPDWNGKSRSPGDLLDSVWRFTPPTAMIVDEPPLFFHAARLSIMSHRLRGPVARHGCGHDHLIIWSTYLFLCGFSTFMLLVPKMEPTPLRGIGGHEWFWGPDAEQFIHPLDKLFTMYLHSVGRNSTLIVGLTPVPDGLIPDADAERLWEFGAEIQRVFGNALVQTNAHSTGNEVILKTGAKPFELPRMKRICEWLTAGAKPDDHMCQNLKKSPAIL